MRDEKIATWQDYALVRTTPNFGRAFYSIERNGRTITRTFNQKKNALKVMKALQAMHPYPILDARIKWLQEEIDKHGHCAQ